MKNKFLLFSVFTILIAFATPARAQVKVGDNAAAINASSLFEMETTNKGMLLPRVALTGTANATPLAGHVAGMSVYNTATAGDVTPGSYFNDGTKWVRIADAAAAWKLGGNASPSSNVFGTTTGSDVLLKANNITVATLKTSGSLDIPATSASGPGVITQNGVNFVHSYGGGNFFAGQSAGNLTLTIGSATNNTASGLNTLKSLTAGNSNTAIGSNALSALTSGNLNTAIGAGALSTNIIGGSNVGVGQNSLLNTTGNNNIAVGNATGQTNITGNLNTFIGANADVAAANLTNATAIGSNAIAGKSNSLILGNGADVGIGTNSPKTRFSVKDSFMVNNAGTVQYANGSNPMMYIFETPASGIDRMVIAHSPGGFSNYGLQFRDAAQQFNFLSNGNPVLSVNVSAGNEFVGVGRTNRLTSAEAFGIEDSVVSGNFVGMYINVKTVGGGTGKPFYGYSINGNTAWYSYLDGANDRWNINRLGTDLVRVSNTGIIYAANLTGAATTLSTDGSGNIIRTPSDARLKNNLKPIDDALSKVLSMNGYTYDFIDGKRFGTNRQMGYMAQDLEKIVPEAVSDGGEYKSVNYPVLTALLSEAIKEQQKLIAEQGKRIQELEKRIKK